MKKRLAILLILLMLPSLASCGGKSGGDTAALSAPASVSAEESAVTDASALPGETLEFHGVRIDIPAGYAPAEATDTSRTFVSADETTVLGFTVMNNVTYGVLTDMYSTPEGIMNAFLQGNGEVMSVDEGEANGKKTLAASAVTEDDEGENGSAVLFLIFFDGYSVLIMAAFDNAASENEVTALKEALKDMSF